MGLKERSLPLIYLDTNVFITAFETPLETAGPVRALIARLAAVPGAGVTSELTLAELTAPVTRPGAVPFETRKRMYFELLIYSGSIKLQPVNRAVLLETSNFRRAALQTGAKPKLPNAIHIVTAVRSGCGLLMSHDRRLGPLPDGMKAVAADSAGIAEALRALNV